MDFSALNGLLYYDSFGLIFQMTYNFSLKYYFIVASYNDHLVLTALGLVYCTVYGSCTYHLGLFVHLPSSLHYQESFGLPSIFHPDQLYNLDFSTYSISMYQYRFGLDFQTNPNITNIYDLVDTFNGDQFLRPALGIVYCTVCGSCTYNLGSLWYAYAYCGNLSTYP